MTAPRANRLPLNLRLLDVHLQSPCGLTFVIALRATSFARNVNNDNNFASERSEVDGFAIDVRYGAETVEGGGVCHDWYELGGR